LKATVIKHVGPERVELREVAVGEPSAGEVLVQAEYSAISSGTETMIFRGEGPEEFKLDETIPSLCGSFSYPFAYGYSLVGRVVKVGSAAQEDWLGRRVFAFHPHQDFVLLPIGQCCLVPDAVSPRAAGFLPNVETACNFVMDTMPVLGERLLVIGQGVVGLLTTAILSAFPLGALVAADRLSSRREWAQRLGATAVVASVGARSLVPAGAFDDADALADFDAVIEVSGNPKALDEAIAVTGFSGRIVVGSWYGRKRASVNLGGVFHRQRIRIISSQVSTVSPELLGRWTKARRLALAWDWVRRIAPELLITHVFTPSCCQEAYEQASTPEGGALQVVFQYP
jgi:2-desacetyl-2-hydroxyethyl bacteriochlorophyllide A dehydrogenase